MDINKKIYIKNIILIFLYIIKLIQKYQINFIQI